MRRDMFLMVGLSFLVSAHAMAADCGKAILQPDLDACAAQDFVKANGVLDNTFQSVVKRLKGDMQTRRLLIAAQKAWLTFRDAECAFATSASESGSAYPMVVAGCRAKLTTERTKMLQAYLDCPEGDLACPLPPP